MNKLKDIINVIIILAYIFIICAMIINIGKYSFQEIWMYYLNIILLGIGFYEFIEKNK